MYTPIISSGFLRYEKAIVKIGSIFSEIIGENGEI